MTARYPVLLDLSRARAVVVGGGNVALRKVRALAEHGGRPAVIAPGLLPELRAIVERNGFELQPRAYRSGDLEGARLVIAATDSAEVNAAVAAEAEARGAWVNVVDDPDRSTIQIPASLREGDITVALATGGASPLLARRLRERLAEVVTPGLGRAVTRLGEAREDVRARWPDDESRRRAFWFELITQEFLDCAIAGRDDEVEVRIQECLSKS